jgi:hypothetical protein
MHVQDCGRIHFVHSREHSACITLAYPTHILRTTQHDADNSGCSESANSSVDPKGNEGFGFKRQGCRLSMHIVNACSECMCLNAGGEGSPARVSRPEGKAAMRWST